jgi:hypothetical protein
MRIFRFLVLMLLSTFTLAAEPKTEDAKIQGLIDHIGGMANAKFYRNGSEYDAKSAAKFLTAKWNKQKKGINSAEEFIEKVATKSSTSGKPYLIKLEDGKQVECGPYLSGRLKQTGKPPAKP